MTLPDKEPAHLVEFLALVSVCAVAPLAVVAAVAVMIVKLIGA